MNKEDFVSLECAKLLKEKGYNEQCLSFYSATGVVWNAIREDNHNESETGYSRPTLYEAQKWLRENRDIDIMIYSHHKTRWFFDLWKLSDADSDFLDCSNKYNSYESALNAGIIKALKLIEK